MKGNGYWIADNTGGNARQDVFQTHVVLAGWGNDNIFANSLTNVDWPGVGFFVQRVAGHRTGRSAGRRHRPYTPASSRLRGTSSRNYLQGHAPAFLSMGARASTVGARKPAPPSGQG